MLTAEQRASGTPAYMAPEIILGAMGMAEAPDVYSIGCLAYWLLTGHLVFEGTSPMQMLVHHVETRTCAPPQRAELPIPAEWDRIVLACLEKDPDRRPQNAEDLWKMLPRFQQPGKPGHIRSHDGVVGGSSSRPHAATGSGGAGCSSDWRASIPKR